MGQWLEIATEVHEMNTTQRLNVKHVRKIRSPPIPEGTLKAHQDVSHFERAQARPE